MIQEFYLMKNAVLEFDVEEKSAGKVFVGDLIIHEGSIWSVFSRNTGNGLIHVAKICEGVPQDFHAFNVRDSVKTLKTLTNLLVEAEAG